MGLCHTCKEENDRSSRTKYCSDCITARTLYSTTQGNLAGGFNRIREPPKMKLSIDEFCLWRKNIALVCHYCGITEEQIPLVGMVSQIQRPMRNMGVDRLGSDGDYTLDNIAPCCFVCNQIKGNRFNEDEMHLLGPSITGIWNSRLTVKNTEE